MNLRTVHMDIPLYREIQDLGLIAPMMPIPCQRQIET